MKTAFGNFIWPTSAFCFGPPCNPLICAFGSGARPERSPEGGAQAGPQNGAF
jgi:hypothetical protein